MTVNEKLIRDEIPGIADRNGDRLVVRRADASELPGLLVAKLVEETREAGAEVEADDRIALLGELADVSQVVHDLAAWFGWSSEDVEKARWEKERERGGFGQGLVMRLIPGGRA